MRTETAAASVVEVAHA